MVDDILVKFLKELDKSKLSVNQNKSFISILNNQTMEAPPHLAPNNLYINRTEYGYSFTYISHDGVGHTERHPRSRKIYLSPEEAAARLLEILLYSQTDTRSQDKIRQAYSNAEGSTVIKAPAKAAFIVSAPLLQ